MRRKKLIASRRSLTVIFFTAILVFTGCAKQTIKLTGEYPLFNQLKTGDKETYNIKTNITSTIQIQDMPFVPTTITDMHMQIYRTIMGVAGDTITSSLVLKDIGGTINSGQGITMIPGLEKLKDKTAEIKSVKGKGIIDVNPSDNLYPREKKELKNTFMQMDFSEYFLPDTKVQAGDTFPIILSGDTMKCWVSGYKKMKDKSVCIISFAGKTKKMSSADISEMGKGEFTGSVKGKAFYNITLSRLIKIEEKISGKGNVQLPGGKTANISFQGKNTINIE